MLNRHSDFRVVATSDGSHALLKARKEKIHIVLMDMSLRNYDGLRLVASMSKEFPEVKVIGLGLIPTQSDIVEFIQAGAVGFILKDATVADFLKTVRLVASGEKVLPPPLTASLFSHVVEYALKRSNGPPHSVVRMSKREREIIALIAEGLSNKEIAQRLHIVTYTVKSHVHNILEKLALHSRLQIAAHAHNDATS